MPNNLIDTDLEIIEALETTQTYKLTDIKIQGFIDKLEALKQAIYKMLDTEKYEYPIYSFSYGINLVNLVENDIVYGKIEMKRRIQECLLQDERIKSVDNFIFTVTGDEILCEFSVTSIYGEINITKEGNI